MRNHIKWLSLLLCLLSLPLAALSDEAPYLTLTERYDRSYAYSQNGYLPDRTFFELDGKALKRPADLFVEGEHLFISDEGNKRVLLCTQDGAFIRSFGQGVLQTPAGICARDGKLYVADQKLEQVLVYDVASGKELRRLSHPKTALYGIKTAFKPLRVAVDVAGSLYVISKGNTNGIAQFSADGSFLGYFGANTTELSMLDKIKRLTYTEKQLEQLKRNVPATPTSLVMDWRGLIYTVTTGVRGVKRLSMAGSNNMQAAEWGFANAIDVAVGAQETVYVINEQGYIMEYTRDGRVLFYFGGEDLDRTRTGLFVATVAIDVDSQGRLYVLDRDKALVQRFEQTEYARLVHEALALYQDGQYAKSREPWEQVARLNSMFDYAQMGLGKAYYKLDRYDEALHAFRLGGDKAGYSDAFWELRNQWLQKHILWVVGGLVLLILMRRAWRVLRMRWQPAMAVHRARQRFLALKLPRELAFISRFPKNPADGFYGVRFEGKVSVLSSSLLYLLTFALYLLNKYASGFLFKQVQDGRYEVASDVALVFGGIALFLIACNLICSIREGEGSFRQMYCGLAYALWPYLLLKPIAILLSYGLTYNEAFLIRLLDVLSWFGVLVMLVLMVKSIQNYSFKETILNLLLTLFTMLMIVVALVIAAALVMQLWDFVTGVLREARFYNEG